MPTGAHHIVEKLTLTSPRHIHDRISQSTSGDPHLSCSDLRVTHEAIVEESHNPILRHASADEHELLSAVPMLPLPMQQRQPRVS